MRRGSPQAGALRALLQIPIPYSTARCLRRAQCGRAEAFRCDDGLRLARLCAGTTLESREPPPVSGVLAAKLPQTREADLL